MRRLSTVVSLRIGLKPLHKVSLLLVSRSYRLYQTEHELRSPESMITNQRGGVYCRSFKHMGCAHGCREGYRGPSAEFLRSQAQLLLTRLLKIDERSVSVSGASGRRQRG